MSVYDNPPYNPQDTKMVHVRPDYYLTKEALKEQINNDRQIKDKSPAQKNREERQKEREIEREERRTKILDEYLNIKVSKKKIDNEISSKNMEIFNLKLTNEAEISVKEEKLKELEKLKSTRKDLDIKINSLADQLLLLKKEEAEEEEAAAAEEAEEAAAEGGGKRKSKGKSKKVAKKPVVSQKKQSIYKEILGKQMKIYKMPDSRKEYVKYKGELLHISDYKDLMKQKAIAKTKTKVTKVTQKKAKSKTKK